MPSPIDTTAARALRERLQGDLLLPDDDGYDEARTVWNGRFQPRPAGIVRCRSDGDVAAAIESARQHALPLSVRGGGHSYAGHSMADGIAIDLSPMSGVRVDPDRRTVVVEPGAVWGDVDRATQAAGLATTGGTVSTVGVAGYVLGGGTGFLSRKFGLGLDNLLAAEVVTADGQRVRASDSENPGLFWALRGGGGNFGVVTSFEIRLHEVGPQVLAGQIVHPLDRAPEVLRFYREFMADAPDALQGYAFFLRVPPVEAFPEQRHGDVAVFLVVAYAGDLAEGERVLEPLVRFGKPILSAVGPQPYVELQRSFDAGVPKGLRWYSRAHYLDTLSDEAIDRTISHVSDLPGPFTMVYFEREGGAIARVAPEATAFPHRHAQYALHIFPGWSDPEDDERIMAWARDFHRDLASHATGGVYVNLLPEDQENGVRAAYAENYARLAQVKARWDPGNLFRVNQNIRPPSG